MIQRRRLIHQLLQQAAQAAHIRGQIRFGHSGLHVFKVQGIKPPILHHAEIGRHAADSLAALIHDHAVVLVAVAGDRGRDLERGGLVAGGRGLVVDVAAVSAVPPLVAQPLPLGLDLENGGGSGERAHRLGVLGDDGAGAEVEHQPGIRRADLPHHRLKGRVAEGQAQLTVDRAAVQTGEADEGIAVLKGRVPALPQVVSSVIIQVIVVSVAVVVRLRPAHGAVHVVQG